MEVGMPKKNGKTKCVDCPEVEDARRKLNEKHQHILQKFGDFWKSIEVEHEEKRPTADQQR